MKLKICSRVICIVTFSYNLAPRRRFLSTLGFSCFDRCRQAHWDPRGASSRDTRWSASILSLASTAPCCPYWPYYATFNHWQLRATTVRWRQSRLLFSQTCASNCHDGAGNICAILCKMALHVCTLMRRQCWNEMRFRWISYFWVQ